MSSSPTVPTPPPGYSVENLPDFMKDANANTEIVGAAPAIDPRTGGQIIADAPLRFGPLDSPNVIEVRDPRAFDQPAQTHESTHKFQQSRNAPFVSSEFAPDGSSRAPTKASASEVYGYGGMDGLIQAQKQGKTIADFNPEQQADMVAAYQDITQHAIKTGNRAMLAQATAAYEPFVGQLARIPGKGANMTQMSQQDLTPPAPGLPPATVAGMPMLPSKLIGGTGMEPTKYVTQSYQGKTIPNLVRSGNIDLSPGKRPNVPNPETGGMSSVWSTSFGTPEGEILVPRVTNGEDGKPPHILSAKIDHKTHTSEAIDYYNKYGQQLGVFKDPDSATAYAQTLHLDQAKQGGEVHPAKKLPPLAAAPTDHAGAQQQYVNTMQKHFQPKPAPPAPGPPSVAVAGMPMLPSKLIGGPVRPPAGYKIESKPR